MGTVDSSFLFNLLGSIDTFMHHFHLLRLWMPSMVKGTSEGFNDIHTFLDVIGHFLAYLPHQNVEPGRGGGGMDSQQTLP